MNTNIFREKSLKRVSSPEGLDSYLRVTKPSVWIAMAALVILLAGAIAWGCLAKIETKAAGVITSDGGNAVCYVSEQDIADIAEGTVIRTDKNEYTVAAIAETPIPASEILSDYIMTLGGFEESEYVYALTVDGRVRIGNYRCEVVLESISPITLLLDSSS